MSAAESSRAESESPMATAERLAEALREFARHTRVDLEREGIVVRAGPTADFAYVRDDVIMYFPRVAIEPGQKLAIPTDPPGSDSPRSIEWTPKQASDLLRRVEQAARESPEFYEDLEEFVRRRSGLRGIAEWEVENGDLTSEELEDARRALFGDSPAEGQP